MRSGYLCLAAAGAIGVVAVGDAVVIGFTDAAPVIRFLITVSLLPPFVVFLYLGVLELVWGSRLGGPPPQHRNELVLGTQERAEIAANTHPLRADRLEELPTQPQREAA